MLVILQSSLLRQLNLQVQREWSVRSARDPTGFTIWNQMASLPPFAGIIVKFISIQPPHGGAPFQYGGTRREAHSAVRRMKGRAGDGRADPPGGLADVLTPKYARSSLVLIHLRHPRRHEPRPFTL